MLQALRVAAVLCAVVCAVPCQQSFTERTNARHSKQAPLVGDPLPDATGHTADGAPFALREDRGSLTVLVFGCLT